MGRSPWKLGRLFPHLHQNTILNLWFWGALSVICLWTSVLSSNGWKKKFASLAQPKKIPQNKQNTPLMDRGTLVQHTIFVPSPGILRTGKMFRWRKGKTTLIRPKQESPKTYEEQTSEERKSKLAFKWFWALVEDFQSIVFWCWMCALWQFVGQIFTPTRCRRSRGGLMESRLRRTPPPPLPGMRTWMVGALGLQCWRSVLVVAGRGDFKSLPDDNRTYSFLTDYSRLPKNRNDETAGTRMFSSICLVLVWLTTGSLFPISEHLALKKAELLQRQIVLTISGELLEEFFRFYGEFNFQDEGLCAVAGRTVPKPNEHQHEALYLVNIRFPFVDASVRLFSGRARRAAWWNKHVSSSLRENSPPPRPWSPIEHRSSNQAITPVCRAALTLTQHLLVWPLARTWCFSRARNIGVWGRMGRTVLVMVSAGRLLPQLCTKGILYSYEIVGLDCPPLQTYRMVCWVRVRVSGV